MQELHPSLNAPVVPAPQKTSAQPAATSMIALKTGPVVTGIDEEKPTPQPLATAAFRYTDWAAI